uniref:Phage Tail Collar Domain n=1 Tax=Candidatus Kentrum sp. FW TaxID=2126338 RepID=A0A450SKH4_9GAMM|nr:MAG: hypothetical protein BECKFW1821B_GA0114236_10173 [Candidatus Kentron sp. FW]
MKKLGFLAVLFLLPFLSACTDDSSADCNRIIEQGIKDAYGIQTLDAYREALREVLNHSHEELTRYANTKDGSIAVPLSIVEAILRVEASRPEVKEFLDGLRTKYSADPDLVLDNLDFDALGSIILHGKLVTAWSQCGAGVAEEGVAVQGLAAEGDDIIYRINGEENEIFSITFTYLPKGQTDPILVQVAYLTVIGGGVQHVPIRIKEGTNFHRHEDYTQLFKRTDPKKDITIQLDLKGRPGIEIAVPALKPQDIIPVGTVVQSMLPWDEYVEAVNDEEDYDPDATDPYANKWAPCDGRTIEGSYLAGLWNKNKAPDLRGVFLRGLNEFDYNESDFVDPVSDEQKDPDWNERTEAGIFQKDNVGGHEHTYKGGRAENWAKTGHGDDSKDIWHGGDMPQEALRPTVDNPTGETRPKNVAVYYYIKIN